MAVKKKARQRRKAQEYESYIFRIDDWKPGYSFGLNNSRLFDGPYWEHLEVTLTGVFLSPDKAKDRQASLTLLANRREMATVNEPEKSNLKPLGVGSLTVRGKRTDFLGSIPHDSMWGMVQLLSCGAVRMLNLYGHALHRGEATITNLHFEREIDPEDW